MRRPIVTGEVLAARVPNIKIAETPCIHWVKPASTWLSVQHQDRIAAIVERARAWSKPVYTLMVLPPQRVRWPNREELRGRLGDEEESQAGTVRGRATERADRILWQGERPKPAGDRVPSVFLPRNLGLRREQFDGLALVFSLDGD